VALVGRIYRHRQLPYTVGRVGDESCGGWHRGALTWDAALFAQTSVSLANATVVACVSAASPVLSLNATQNCSTGRRDAGTRRHLRAWLADPMSCYLTQGVPGALSLARTLLRSSCWHVPRVLG